MTSREETVDRTNGALGNLYQALAGLYEQRAKYGTGFQIMGEPLVGEIFKLRKEIDHIIGLTDYVAEFGVPPTDEEIDAMASRGAPLPNGAPASESQTTKT